MQRCGFRKYIGSRDSAVSFLLFYFSFFFFHAEEQLNVGTAAGLEDLY